MRCIKIVAEKEWVLGERKEKIANDECKILIDPRPSDRPSRETGRGKMRQEIMQKSK
jgi:hypothetical protein